MVVKSISEYDGYVQREYSGWPWPCKGATSPHYNRLILEARIRKGPYTNDPGADRLFAWCWFQFRNIKEYEPGKYAQISTVQWMKVMAWTREASILLRAEKNDFLHVEGWLTASRNLRGEWNMAVLAKKLYVREDIKVGAWEAAKQRSKEKMAERRLETAKLVAKGLIRPSLGQVAAMPDTVPEVDIDDLSFDV